MDKMEDIAKIATGVAGGIASDEAVRYFTTPKPSETAKSIARNIEVRVIPASGARKGQRVTAGLEPWKSSYEKGNFYYVVKSDEFRPGDVLGVIYLNIKPEGFYIGVVQTHGHDIEVSYRGEEITLDKPARGVKYVER